MPSANNADGATKGHRGEVEVSINRTCDVIAAKCQVDVETVTLHQASGGLSVYGSAANSDGEVMSLTW